MDIVPSQEVYRVPPQNNRVKQQSYGYSLPVLKKAMRSKDGEMLSVYEGYPVPRKGIIYYEAVRLTNQAKRRTLTTFVPFGHKALLLPGLVFIFLTSWKTKISWLEHLLWNYNRELLAIYNDSDNVPYLKYEYYNNCSKTIWDLIRIFLTELGVKEEIANDLGWNFATLLEYDDYYKVVIEDPLTDMTAEEAQDPVGFIKKFMKILSDRSPENRDTINKFSKFAGILTLAFYHPKIKQAWKKAFASIDFKKLQLDDLEYFWQMPRANYDLRGIKLEVRFAEYCQKLRDYWMETYPDAKILKTDDQKTAEAKLCNSPTFIKLQQEGPLNINWGSIIIY